MPHGYPDWGRDDPGELLYGLPDMAELAARLGSIDTHDRHGHVIWLDDFESGIAHWNRGGGGIGNEVVWTAEYNHSGGFCARLTTGNLTDDYAYISKHIMVPVMGRLGLEFALMIGGNIDYVEMRFLLHDGATLWETRINIDPTNNRLQYRDNLGVYQTFAAPVLILRAATMFHIAKLVVDFQAGMYARFIFDNVTYDLSPFAIQGIGGFFAPYIDIMFYAFTSVDDNRNAFIDNVIVTQHEP